MKQKEKGTQEGTKINELCYRDEDSPMFDISCRGWASDPGVLNTPFLVNGTPPISADGACVACCVCSLSPSQMNEWLVYV